MDVQTRILVWRTAVLLRRANLRRRRRLRRDLAAYSSRELVDLECAIERYPPDQTQELRSMLGSLRLQRSWARPHHAG